MVITCNTINFIIVVHTMPYTCMYKHTSTLTLVIIAGAAEKEPEILPSTKELKQTMTRSMTAMPISPPPPSPPGSSKLLAKTGNNRLRQTQTQCMNVLLMAVTTSRHRR